MLNRILPVVAIVITFVGGERCVTRRWVLPSRRSRLSVAEGGLAAGRVRRLTRVVGAAAIGLSLVSCTDEGSPPATDTGGFTRADASSLSADNSNDVGNAAISACIATRKALGYREVAGGTLEGPAFGGINQDRDFSVRSVTELDVSPADRANTPGFEALYRVELGYIGRTTVNGAYGGWFDRSAWITVRKRSGGLEVQHARGGGALDELWLPPEGAPQDQLAYNGDFCGAQ